jgi:hypothetical protein
VSGGRPWTTTERRKLLEMRARRITVREIGRCLNRTQDAIFSFLRYIPAGPGSPPKMGSTPRLPPRPEPGLSEIYWTREQIRTLRALAEDGVSMRDAAEMLGRTLSAVRTKASHLEIRFSSRSGKCRDRLEQETRHFIASAGSASAQLLYAIEQAGVRP